MKKVCAKMLLYARQNKNNSNFDFAIGELLIFLE